MLTRRALCAAVAAAPFVSAAHADEYPSRPIRVISPFPSRERFRHCRPVSCSTRFRKRIGQPMVVEVKPGAGGIVGFADVAKADPDGYTVVTSSTTMGTTDGVA
jgi:tripartite-type tricarboxylate transporter receptor subunit TctC